MKPDKHTLIVLNPGHFHAALTLRKSHPRLNDDVYVYSEAGPDVESFVGLVESFNRRDRDPTRWKLHVYRGVDYLARLLADRPGDVVVIASRNDSKLSSIHRLHAEGFLVLGDKPWLIGVGGIGMLREIAATPPLAMDIMTERHEVTTQVQKALAARPDVFGQFRTDGSEPAIHIKSVHHLYKMVNQRPLVRPAWYFDVAAQGEGITDVTTHLVDLAQWMTSGGAAFHYERDIELQSARQWPTAVPHDVFTRITGLPDFPDALRNAVVNDTLRYLCNAEISFRLRGVLVTLESIWNLAIPEGGGDTHHAIVRGTKADLIVDQGPETHFVPELTVRPASDHLDCAGALTAAMESFQPTFPGLGAEAEGGIFRITIPKALRSTHEEHFAAVLEEFLGYVDSGRQPESLAADLVAKYTLLARASELSHRN